MDKWDMKSDKRHSRRDFLKSATVMTAGAAGSSLAISCTSAGKYGQHREIPLHTFSGEGYVAGTGTPGLLFSQVGYERDMPVRIVVRLPKRHLLSEKATCILHLKEANERKETPCNYWGEVWGDHWWVVEFPAGMTEGEWKVWIADRGRIVFADEGLLIRRNVLWDSTIRWSTVDMLERRSKFSECPAGWQDAGTLWAESCSQSAMIISMVELLERSTEKLDTDLQSRIQKQITVGCDYLVMLGEKAKERGYPSGAMSHDLHGHEDDILPHDVMNAVVALYGAKRILPGSFEERKQAYRQMADMSSQWLIERAKPMGRRGMKIFQRGIPEDTPIPDNKWATRHIVLMCWAFLERWKTTNSSEDKQRCVDYVKELMKRQIPKEESEAGYFGHFYEFPGLSHSEQAWVHGIADGQFGADLGGFYPNYLMPVIWMVQNWAEHPDAKGWRSMLELFVRGYLKPACAANPFNLLPLGIFGEEGPIWFCGTFHGTNAIYGYTAALALELASLLDDLELVPLAYGNLQWIAGLNGGITRANMEKGCVVFSADIPEAKALPVSMICGIGKRWGGTWFQTRGVICNGFSTGEQFVYDVAPLRKNDGPHSLTDEDWIPHSAAWVTALIRLDSILKKDR